MREQFCTYEISLKLKELGFDEPCLGYYEVSNYLEFGFRLRFIEHEDSNPSKQPSNKDCLAPLWQQVIDWFREKYKINCVVGYTDNDKEEFMAVIDRPNQDIDYNMNSTESYYEAREQTILKALELIENSET